MRLLPVLLIAGALAVLGGARGTALAAQGPNSANRMIMWVGCRDILAMSDADLDMWRSRGVGGFVCNVSQMYGMGGAQDFTADLSSLTGSRYDLERQLRDARVGDRLRARDMIAYLGVNLVNYWNPSTPLADWFDDSAWSQVVLPDLRNAAGAARALGFSGLAFDQELYPQDGSVETATWSWRYPGNSRSEQATRERARRRGQQVMGALLDGFPGLDLFGYKVSLPGSWEEVVQKEVNHVPDAFGANLDVNFWDGLSSVPGYGALRLFDATFYKTPHFGTWDTALRYDYNSLFAFLSRRFSNWGYASSRFFVSPFGWIDSGPCCQWDAARSPQYVSEQLAAFRRWGMGRQFGNFAYNPLSQFDYSPYLAGMQAASTPGVVDNGAPSLSVDPPARRPSPSARLQGVANDGMAVRDVRWKNDDGGSGAAQMAWRVDSGNYTSGMTGHMTWTAAGVPLHPGQNRITVTATGIKGRSSSRVVIAAGPAQVRQAPGAQGRRCKRSGSVKLRGRSRAKCSKRRASR